VRPSAKSSRLVVSVIIVLLAVAAASVPAGGEAEAAEAADHEWSVTFDATFYGKYIFRGINVVDGPVQGVECDRLGQHGHDQR